MNATYQDVVKIADQLPLDDKARLIEHLIDELLHDRELVDYNKLPWHVFIELTAGSLADDPIEPPPQLPWTEREPLE